MECDSVRVFQFRQTEADAQVENIQKMPFFGRIFLCLSSEMAMLDVDSQEQKFSHIG